MSKELAEALRATLISPNETDSNMEPANIVDGVFEIARAIHRVADALERLGLGDASTQMGALEAVAKELRDGLGAVATAVSERSQDA